MKIQDFILNSLNIRKEEKKSTTLLILYSFLMGSAFSIFYTASTSLFVSIYSTKMFPVSYIAAGSLGLLATYIYTTFQKKTSFTKINLTASLFLIISIAVFSLGYTFTEQIWMIFVLFIWVRIFMFVHGVVFWGIAGRLYNLQQSKRLFGLITSGEVLSQAISSFSIPLLMKFINPEHLLFIAISNLIISFFIISYIIKTFNTKINSVVTSQNKKQKLNTENTGFRSSRYNMLIFLVAFLIMFGHYFVDYIFYAQAKTEYTDKKVLTTFVGVFFGFAYAVEFIIKVFLGGRLLNKYGIKLGLLLLPGVLIISYLLSSVIGTFYGTAGMFFSFVLFGRLSMNVLRKSISDPSFQILFQPIPVEQRAAFQSKVEGTPKAIGNFIAGVVLLLLSGIATLTLVHYSYIFLIISILWIKLAYDLYKEYRKTLEDILNKQKTNQHKTEENSTDIIVNELPNSKYPDELLFILYRIDPQDANKKLTNFIKEKKFYNENIINKLVEFCAFETISLLKDLEQSETNLLLKETIKKATEKLTETNKFNIDKLNQLADSDKITDRIIAARLIGDIVRFKTFNSIIKLIRDKEITVASMAMLAVGQIKKKELWIYVIEKLTDPTLSYAARNTLINIGNPVLSELEVYFNKNENNADVQIQIVKIYEKIGTKNCIQLLRSKMNSTNKFVKMQVLLSLGKLNYKANYLERTSITTALDVEISTLVWLMAAINDLKNIETFSGLVDALNEEVLLKREKVFILLSLLYDNKTINLIKSNLESDSNAKGYAMEIADMKIDEEIKSLVMPVLENLSPKETIDRYSSIYPQIKLKPKERIEDIINHDYVQIGIWIKTVAILHLNEFDKEFTIPLLLANLPNPNLILREAAALELFNLNPDLFIDEVIKFKSFDREVFKSINQKIQVTGRTNNLMIYEKVRLIKGIPFFAGLQDSILIKFAENIKEITLAENFTTNLTDLMNDDECLIVVFGQIVISNKEYMRSFAENNLFIPKIVENFEQLNLDCPEQTFILQVKLYELLNLMSSSNIFTGQVVNQLNNQSNSFDENIQNK